MRRGDDMCHGCRHLRNSHGLAYAAYCRIWGCECREFQEAWSATSREEDLEVTIEEATAFLDEEQD